MMVRSNTKLKIISINGQKIYGPYPLEHFYTLLTASLEIENNDLFADFDLSDALSKINPSPIPPTENGTNEIENSTNDTSSQLNLTNKSKFFGTSRNVELNSLVQLYRNLDSIYISGPSTHSKKLFKQTSHTSDSITLEFIDSKTVENIFSGFKFSFQDKLVIKFSVDGIIDNVIYTRSQAPNQISSQKIQSVSTPTEMLIPSLPQFHNTPSPESPLRTPRAINPVKKLLSAIPELGIPAIQPLDYIGGDDEEENEILLNNLKNTIQARWIFRNDCALETNQLTAYAHQIRTLGFERQNLNNAIQKAQLHVLDRELDSISAMLIKINAENMTYTPESVQVVPAYNPNNSDLEPNHSLIIFPTKGDGGCATHAFNFFNIANGRCALDREAIKNERSEFTEWIKNICTPNKPYTDQRSILDVKIHLAESSPEDEDVIMNCDNITKSNVFTNYINAIRKPKTWYSATEIAMYARYKSLTVRLWLKDNGNTAHIQTFTFNSYNETDQHLISHLENIPKNQLLIKHCRNQFENTQTHDIFYDYNKRHYAFALVIPNRVLSALTETPSEYLTTLDQNKILSNSVLSSLCQLEDNIISPTLKAHLKGHLSK